jgi:hypothetical protein
MSPAGIGQELFEKALRASVLYLDVPPKVSHFRFTLNDQEILADPGWQSGVVLDVKFQCPERDFAKLRPLK